MSSNSEYVAMMEAHLKQWDADFDAAVARGEKADEAARASLRELRANRDAAHSFIARIRMAGDSAGAQMHVAMETSWEAMRKALDHLK